MLSAFDAECCAVSVAVTVKVEVPAAVGVPPMLPSGPRLRPAGKAPLVTSQTYEPVPPLAASVVEYAVPTVPLGSDVVVIVTGAAATVMLNALDAVCALLSVTVAVKFEVPAAVGVPPMLPAGFRLKPAGSVPAVTAHVYPPVPPLADSPAVYAEPAVPFASEVVVTVSGATVTAMLSGFDAVCPVLSVTVAVKFEVPAVVGVPPMVPPELRLRPAGSVPAVTDHVYPPVPPLAASVAE